MTNLHELIRVMEDTRVYLAMEGNDFSWSSWIDQEHALAELDSILAAMKKGSVPAIHILFAPTGPIQEVSLSSGWGAEFLALAQRFDEAYQNTKR